MPRRAEALQVFNLRLPKDLHTRVRHASEISKRSMNGELQERIRRSFEDDDLRQIIREELTALKGEN